MLQVFQTADYYHRKVAEQIHHTKLLLNELKNELPSSGPLKFADANIELIDLISSFFSQEIQHSTNEHDAIACCKKYLKLLQEITKQVLPFLEGINQAFIPSELLLVLINQTKEVAEKLGFSQDFDLCLSPRWDFNYGIHAFKNFVQSALADLPT